MIQGIDVSSYQPSYSTAGIDFVFIKITEGLGYVNPDWVEQRTTARNADLVTGFYHYPNIANSASAEADYFLSQINLVPGDILCLDWEWYGQSVSDSTARAYKDAWISRVRVKAPGHRIVVYVDRNNWLTVDQDSNCGDGLWIADYVTAGSPRVSHPWVFHQYTSTPLDKDVANFPTRAALNAWALGEDNSMPLSDADIEKVATAVTSKLLGYINGPAGTPDVYGMIGDIHKATVAPSIKSLVDGAMHTLGEHTAATNAAAFKAQAEAAAIAKKVGA